MLYSSACGYAIRALTYLADRPRGEFFQAKDIARVEDIPAPFLGKILPALVRAGLLRSSKGPHGGYTLARRPTGITLLAIKAAIDGLAELDGCASGLGRCSSSKPCAQHDRFKPLRERIRGYLTTTTVADMTRALAGKRAALSRPRPRP